LLQQDKLLPRAKMLVASSLAVLLFGGILTSQDVIGDRMSQVVHAFGETTWALLLVYAALAAALWQRHPSSDPVPASS